MKEPRRSGALSSSTVLRGELPENGDPHVCSVRQLTATALE
jgi:hypothetical protein